MNCDKIYNHQSLAKPIRENHQGKIGTGTFNTMTRKCVKEKIELEAEELISTRVNGVKTTLRVLQSSKATAGNYYNYYNLVMEEGDKLIRINMEKQRWTELKREKQGEEDFTAVVPTSEWGHQAVKNAKHRELQELLD